MRMAVVALALAGAHLFFPASRLAPRASQQVFKSGVDGVTVVVSVRSGNKPVPGLTAEDFELRDNGVAQAITSVAAEQVPLDLSLLLD